MVGKDYVFRRGTGDAGSAFATLLDRITDRLLPISYPREASVWVKYGVTSVGSLVWCIYGAIWTYGMTYERFIRAFSRSHEENDIFAFPDSWLYSIVGFYGVALLILSAIIVPLIGRSFGRGQPLTFFFLGLIFPTAALGVLRYAFPDGSTGDETSTNTPD